MPAEDLSTSEMLYSLNQILRRKCIEAVILQNQGERCFVLKQILRSSCTKVFRRHRFFFFIQKTAPSFQKSNVERHESAMNFCFHSLFNQLQKNCFSSNEEQFDGLLLD